jgi:hypothetical protein
MGYFLIKQIYYIFTSKSSFKAWFVVSILRLKKWFGVDFCTFKLSFVVDILAFLDLKQLGLLFEKLGEFLFSNLLVTLDLCTPLLNEFALLHR